MTDWDLTPDHERAHRIGFDESIFCAGKSLDQITRLLERAASDGHTLLLTRLQRDKFDALRDELRRGLDYDEVSCTAFFGPIAEIGTSPRVALVAAGSSDVGVAREAVRTLRYYGHACTETYDVGVAGLWRLLGRIDEIKRFPIVIVVAGMDGALPSVMAGLVPGVVIAVPGSSGYGVAAGGQAALHAALASCAPGLLVVNVDNGYGAACAALRVLRLLGAATRAEASDAPGFGRLGMARP
jgi:NCAIR mutase (PurE)-related protein